MGFLEKIEELDTALFLFINGKHHPYIDVLMALVSHKLFWIPLYALMLLFLAKKLGWKRLLVVIPVVALMILATDQVSVHLFKNVFQRYRPCYNENIKHLVHLVNGCGGQYGFVSSHAINVFALAVYTGLMLKDHFKYYLVLIVFWAALICYSRVYLGVHYPSDVFAGALLGTVAGYLAYRLHNLLHSKFFRT